MDYENKENRLIIWNNSDLIDINHSIHHSKMSFNNSSRNQTNDELYITAPMLSDKKNESVETINLSSDIDFESSAISVDNVKEQFLKNIIDNRNKLKCELTENLNKSYELVDIKEKEIEKWKEAKLQSDQHLSNLELAYADLHSKYQNLKSAFEQSLDNLEILERSNNNNIENFEKLEARYESLKMVISDQLKIDAKAFKELKSKRRDDYLKLEMQVTRLKIENQSLYKSLVQRDENIQELNAMCERYLTK